MTPRQQTTASTIRDDTKASIPSASPTISHYRPATLDDSGMLALEELPPPEVTSNIRQGSPSPDPPSFPEASTAFLRPIRKPVAGDHLFALPPPDLRLRFVPNPDISYPDEATSVSTSDGPYDAARQLDTLVHAPSPPPPRIYFAPSAITYIPPLSYDFLERDPDVKGVPRNYRAWTRAGRPKLDIDGVERSEAKSDFLAMGRIFPHDSESEDGGNEGEKEKKRRRKKKSAKVPVVPIERPRRMTRKIVEPEPPAPPPPPKKPVIEKKVKEFQPQITPAVKKVVEMTKETAPKSDEKSDSSGRRSSSTLLDTDAVVKSKKKRVHSGNEPVVSPAAKKPRLSKRIYAKKHGVGDTPVEYISLVSAAKTEPEHSQSPLSDLTPSPQPSAAASHQGTSIHPEHRSSSPGPSSSRPSRGRGRPPRSARPSSSRPTQLLDTQTLTVQIPASQLPASRPGHRLSRDVTQPLPLPMRSFPTSLPILAGYSAFYRRYPLITQFERDDPVGKYISQEDSQPKRSLGNWNQPRDHRDLYTPRYTKGSGNKKIALCPLCFEDRSRGGEGRQEWNHTKTSQHNYHMQYYHGISATKCTPFSPPIAQRMVAVPRPQTNEKSEILQGKCHNCKQWIALEGSKIGELKVKELFWWKHAAHCHKDSSLAGESDIFIEDDAFNRLREYETANPS